MLVIKNIFSESKSWKPSWFFPRVMYELSYMKILIWDADIFLVRAFLAIVPLVGYLTNKFLFSLEIILCAGMWSVFGYLAFADYGKSAAIVGMIVMCYATALLGIALVLESVLGVRI